jgi:hypothetical protein
LLFADCRKWNGRGAGIGALAKERTEERFHKEDSAEMLPNTGANGRFGIRAALGRGEEEEKLWKVYK